jgi:endo-1,4-beta-xylanase
MKKTMLLLYSLVLCGGLQAKNLPSLKDVLGKYFMVGTAVNVEQVNGNEPKAMEIIQSQFNSVVAENCMKPENIEPQEGKFNFENADKFVQFGLDNHMKVIGHVLVWHSQTAPWMFVNKHGELPNREEMIKRMHDYISTVVGRYKGKVLGWDVVNEAILDDGTLRESPWYRAIGPEYLELAFKFAHEADPDAELYYNDYSMAKEPKREMVVKLIQKLKADGCRIDAVGMQSHNGYNYPDISEFEKTIQAIIGSGVKVQFTEMDLNMLPNPTSFSGADVNQKFAQDPQMNPYTKGLTKEAEQKFNELYLSYFQLFKKYAEHVNRVCLWGVTDNSSWLNDWPIKGRTNYPLLFDRKYKAKPVVEGILDIFK